MRSLLNTAFILLCALLCNDSTAQNYFKINGRQIIDENGDPFFPVIMTYTQHLVHDDNISVPHLNPTMTELNDHYYLSPDYHMGVVNDYECTSVATCHDDIEEDFQKIKDLGFNTVRFGFNIKWKPGGSPMQNKFYVRTFENCGNIDGCWNDSDYVEFDYDAVNGYANSDVLNFMIDRIDELINIAISPPYNFKVMLSIGNGGSNVPDNTTAPNAFTALLAHVASHFSNYTSLISYDIASEPVGSENYFTSSKQQVCDWTTLWYDALKGADPNHLICTNGDVKDVIYWDPAVIKADFFAIHPYPELLMYEKTTPGYDVGQAAIDRFVGRMYWFRNYCPKPFSIGETGFTAADFANPDFDQDYPTMPGLDLQDLISYDGTIAQQHDFAEQSFLSLMDCDGIAYNWWNYQDNWNYEVGYGLLHHGEVPSTTPNPPDWLHKPAADVFINPPTPTYICDPPGNYADPYNCGMFNTNQINAVTGQMVDNNNNGIGGGFLQALNFIEKISIGGGNFQYIHSWLYSYSDANGNFEIIPYTPNPLFTHTIVYIRGSAPGTEKFEVGALYPWSTDQQMQNPGTITLDDYVNFKYDGVFNGETISQSENKNLKGWNSVTVSNTTIDGISDITARQEININSEFQASNVSEVHIFPSDAFIDCDAVSGFYRMVENNSTPTQLTNIQKEIEIDFKKSVKPNVEIIPNPNSGVFTIEIFNAENSLISISIKNPIGNDLDRFISLEQKISLDLRYFSKGIYFVEVIIGNNKIVKKLIIN